MPEDTIKGRWLSDPSQQSRKASRFASKEVQEITQRVEEELEPVLNRNDLNQGGSSLKQSQFGRSNNRNFHNTDDEDEDEDKSWRGQTGQREYGMEQGQERLQVPPQQTRDRILSEKTISTGKKT